MRDIPLTMIRPTMTGLPRYACPPGYRVRSWTPGDEAHWARIEALAGPFADVAAARSHFDREFAPHAARLPGRMLFLESEAEGVFGTTTAWEGDFRGERWGRIHWVAILPEQQGRGLAKPLLSAAMEALRVGAYPAAYLTTETTSWRGINLYLGFGFRPLIETDEDREGWAIVEEVLGKRIVDVTEGA